jgi:hypothetical protein
LIFLPHWQCPFLKMHPHNDRKVTSSCSYRGHGSVIAIMLGQCQSGGVSPKEHPSPDTLIHNIYIVMIPLYGGFPHTNAPVETGPLMKRICSYADVAC